MKYVDANLGCEMYNFDFFDFLKTSNRILGAVIRQIIQDFNHIPLI